jgi:crossover junction endodeoxyribonuclease RuvC
MTRIIGIDPGLNKTGWAIIQKKKDNSLALISAGAITTKPTDEMPQRLLVIHRGINEVISTFSPVHAAIEDTYVNKNYASSLKLAHARASAILTLSLKNLSAKEYSAKTIKKTITGNGNAEKDQVAYMIQCLIPGSKNDSADINDAIAIAICHSFYLA